MLMVNCLRKRDEVILWQRECARARKKIEKKLCGVIIIARQANTQQSFQEFCKQHISVM